LRMPRRANDKRNAFDDQVPFGISPSHDEPG
jgi:hypothetical protein